MACSSAAVAQSIAIPESIHTGQQPGCSDQAHMPPAHILGACRHAPMSPWPSAARLMHAGILAMLGMLPLAPHCTFARVPNCKLHPCILLQGWCWLSWIVQLEAASSISAGARPGALMPASAAGLLKRCQASHPAGRWGAGPEATAVLHMQQHHSHVHTHVHMLVGSEAMLICS